LLVPLALIVAGCSLFAGPTATPTPQPTDSPSPEPTITPVPDATPGIGTFQSAAPLMASRIGATATLLLDGRVLIAGGISNGHSVASAEIYNPRTGTSTPTGSMVEARAWHSASLLLPNGKVLIAGGTGDRLCEVYNPATGKFTKTGSLGYAPRYQAATSLGDGRALIAGGINGAQYTSRAEVYNPATGHFVHVRSLKVDMQHATATLLQDGQVLIAGGDQADKKHPNVLAAAELFNPVKGTFVTTGSMIQGRSHFAAVLLQNGKVLAIGGVNPAGYAGLLSTAELYDPYTGRWSATGAMAIGRSDFTATLMADGRVLVAGGGDNSTEIYDPTSATFQMGPYMMEDRVSQTATMLQDTRILMAGGNGDTASEMYQP
jgi:WD40 repeat protein